MNLDNFKSFSRAQIKEENLNMDLWKYDRVSSKDQEQNRSLETQDQAARNYASQNNYNITHSFGSTYESASGDFTRKEFMKLIIAVRSAKKKPFAILIYTISRFSRSGGGGISLANELVEDLGVNLIEVSTGKNTLTEEGKLEIYQGLIRSRQDNLDRLKVTVPGMIKMLEAGHALGRPPRGYVHYGPRVKDHTLYSPVQRIEKSGEARAVRKGWEMKMQGMSDNLIQIKLEEIGLTITRQVLSKMWRNPFYCGVNVNSLLGDKIVKGNWKPIVSEKEFFMVQEILKGNKFGYKKELSNPQRPLMGFIRCVDCNGKMTGYEVLAKGLQYYKCQKCKDQTINAETTKKSKGSGAHPLFVEHLKKYELQPNDLHLFQEQIKMTYEFLGKEKQTDAPIIKKELDKLNADVKNLQRKHVLEGLDKDLYLEFKSELDKKIFDLKQKLEKSGSKISNLQKCIFVSGVVAQNLSNYRASGGHELKKRVQEMIFPDGIHLDVKNRVYLTKKINSVFRLTSLVPRLWEGVNENSHSKFEWLSSSVAGDGFEPTTFGL
jgi:site-specific DNA recombinase